MTAALALANLSVAFGTRTVLRNVSFEIAPGEAYGLVGESGCGKSTLARAALRALPPGGKITSGGVTMDGTDPFMLNPATLRQLRATRLSMVYQDPARALNPALTIGRQLTEVLNLLGTHGKEAHAQAETLLARTRIADPARIMRATPNNLSGGMQQRVVIAMALAKNPSLLILDEPTTSLDATVEAAILDLIAELRASTRAALLFISHNLPLVARICDRVGVLYAGALVEEGRADEVLDHPRHPYTAALLRCRPAGTARETGPLPTIEGTLPDAANTPPGCLFAPRCNFAEPACTNGTPPWDKRDTHGALCLHPDQPAPGPAPFEPATAGTAGPPRALLRAKNLAKTYRAGGRAINALHPTDLTLHEGETLGLVGESGSGKSTLARLLLGLTPPDKDGTLQFKNETLAGKTTARTRAQHKAVQIIFQNPDTALNRAHRIRHILARPLIRLAGLRGQAVTQRLSETLQAVRLRPTTLDQLPRALSGGQKQRVAIARAFAGRPAIVMADEPTSALDVSVQAAILNLLAALRARDNVTTLLISHDFAVIKYLADRIAVMYRGRIVQIGDAAAVLAGPHHPYTETLLAAAGLPPAPPPHDGCAFQTLCPRTLGSQCETETPALRHYAHQAIACHIAPEKLSRQ